MVPLATQADLEGSMGRSLTGAEATKAQVCLGYASNLVRGLAPWVDSMATVPPAVVDAVVSLAERRLTARRDGLRTAGPFTYADAPTASFTADERLLLAGALGLTGNMTVSLAGPDPVI